MYLHFDFSCNDAAMNIGMHIYFRIILFFDHTLQDIYKLNAIPIKTPMTFSKEQQKSNFKICTEKKKNKTLNNQDNFEEEQSQRNHAPLF